MDIPDTSRTPTTELLDLESLDKKYNNRQLTLEEYWLKKAGILSSWRGPRYVIKTDQDIIALVDSLVSEAEERFVYPVMYVHDPRRMMQFGLWPTSVEISAPWFVDWLDKIDDETTIFWGGIDYLVEDFLQNETIWEYKPLQMVREEAVRDGSSIKLLLCAPDLLYSGSKRPKTDMLLFRNSLSIRARRRDIRDNSLVISGEEWKIVPVTRYAIGMSKGLYFKKAAKTEVCGTFYYLEPESSVVLAYKTALRAFNKTDAMHKLGLLDVTNTEVKDVVAETTLHLNGYYPRDLMLTPSVASELYRWRFGEEQMDIQEDIDSEILPQIPHYAGNYLGLYSEEDIFDQPLCIGARKAGYDIVILENMVGAFQVVTEVLDTRNRVDSFRSLVYLTD